MIKSHTGSYTRALDRQLPDSDASFFWDTTDSKKKRKGYRDGLKYDAGIRYKTRAVQRV